MFVNLKPSHSNTTLRACGPSCRIGMANY
jgi:hypothetical protein